jgi:hypothetical protein
MPTETHTDATKSWQQACHAFIPSTTAETSPQPELAAPEQVEHSIRTDKALTATAERRQAEQAVERGDIDLAKRRVLLVAGTVILALLLIVFAAGVFALLANPAVAPVLMSAGAGGSLVTLLVAWIRWG